MENSIQFNKKSLYGIMRIKKESIQQNDISIYKKLHQEIDIGPNNEVGHFIERLWAFLFREKN